MSYPSDPIDPSPQWSPTPCPGCGALEIEDCQCKPDWPNRSQQIARLGLLASVIVLIILITLYFWWMRP